MFSLNNSTEHEHVREFEKKNFENFGNRISNVSPSRQGEYCEYEYPGMGEVRLARPCEMDSNLAAELDCMLYYD